MAERHFPTLQALADALRPFWEEGDWMCGLFLDPDEFSIDMVTLYADLTSEIPAGLGYATGGFPIQNRSVVVVDADNAVYLRAQDPFLESFSGQYRLVNAYRVDTGRALGVVDYGELRTGNGQRLTIDWPDIGLLRGRVPS